MNVITADMAAVNQLIIDRLSSDVVLINQMGQYIVKNGGKRLRPVLVLLAAGACGNVTDDARLVAAIVEFIHTATLLHDDVVDESNLRRGQETANAVWGNEAAVLVGDFLYSRAFELMVEVGNMQVMEVFARTTNQIAAGEVMQLLNINDPDTTEDTYYQVIERKTAVLFVAAAQLGAAIVGGDKAQQDALAEYGLQLGIAFQLIDDVLDYEASEDKLGKQLGDDLAEGKPTLPLIYAMRQGTPEQVQLVRDAIEHANRDNIDAVLEVIGETKALEYTRNAAVNAADKAIEALQVLPQSQHREALEHLVNLAVKRDH